MKVGQKSRVVLTGQISKTVDGNLVQVNLSVSKNTNPDNEEVCKKEGEKKICFAQKEKKDFLFTGMLVPATDADGKASSESTSYGAAELNYKQMNSVGENTIKNCSAVKDFGVAEDANTKHRSEMEDAWIMMDHFGGTEGNAFFGVYDVRIFFFFFFFCGLLDLKRVTTELEPPNSVWPNCICSAPEAQKRTLLFR